MLNRKVSLSLLSLIFCSLYPIMYDLPDVEPSHSIMHSVHAMQVLKNHGMPSDVTNLILQTSWQLKQRERNEWERRIQFLNNDITSMRVDGSDITMVDVMSLTPDEKKMLKCISINSVWQEKEIASLPLYLKNKFGSMNCMEIENIQFS